MRKADTALPLSALLSHLLVAFTIAFDNEAEHRLPNRTTDHGGNGIWLTSLAMYANCVQWFSGDPLSVSTLEHLARTPANLDGMRRWGYITLSTDVKQARRKDALLQLTTRGQAAQQVWQPLSHEIEQRWQQIFGKSKIARLRTSLETLVAQCDPALPDCMPILGPGLRCNGHHAGDDAFASQTPAAELPFHALLSRATLAFAIDFEKESPLSLAICADVLRVLHEEGLRLREIPTCSGVSKESIAMALGILRKLKLAELIPDPNVPRGKLIRLTALGLDGQLYSQKLVSKIESQWHSSFGDNTINTLREATTEITVKQSAKLYESLAAYPNNWRAKLPPITTLPHFPMVLHRGGYPDGS